MSNSRNTREKRRRFGYLGALALALAIAFTLGHGTAEAKRMSQLKQHLPVSKAVAGVTKRPSNVTLLRGGYSIFSGGLNELNDRLTGLGVDAKVTGFGAWRRIVREIVADRKKNGRRPLVLIGHSTGANAVIMMAKALAQEGIEVDYIATLAPTNPAPVPSNVRRVVNYYFEKRGWGLPLKKGPGFHGTLQNKDVSKSAGVDHFNIDENKTYQDEVLRDILRIGSK